MQMMRCLFCRANMFEPTGSAPKIESHRDRVDVTCPHCDSIHIGLPGSDSHKTALGQLRGGVEARLVRMPGDPERHLACPVCFQKPHGQRSKEFLFTRYSGDMDVMIKGTQYELRRATQPFYADPNRTESRWIHWKEFRPFADWQTDWEEAEGKVCCVGCRGQGLRLFDLDRNGEATTEV
jgi:hypothetical protein